MSRILLAEDEELVGTMIRMNLEGAGHQVGWVRDGRTALELCRREIFDLVLLDIGLPQLDGLQVLRDLREGGVLAPVMMLTARGDVSSKVGALKGGADDYLPKPFDVAELLARVEALVRRARAERAIPSEQVVCFGRYSLNLSTREAETNEGHRTLGEKEAALLALLWRARGQTLRRADIIDEVWGMEASPTERTVDNFIVRLRRLFEPDPEKPRHIITVRGTGYRFEP